MIRVSVVKLLVGQWLCSRGLDKKTPTAADYVKRTWDAFMWANRPIALKPSAL